jgi:tetratricopeptide (TPR) repeat protein
MDGGIASRPRSTPAVRRGRAGPKRARPRRALTWWSTDAQHAPRSRAGWLRALLALGALGRVAIAATPAHAAPEPPFWLRIARGPEVPAGESKPSDQAVERASWLTLALERTRAGRYDAAARAYGALVASGANDPAVYTNLAEVLMADGRLAEAEARYRDAIAVANETAAQDPRARAQDLALASYGLAVALDRDEQPAAAREMMGRALALDPTRAVLDLATGPNSDLTFVPEGEVYDYLGLAAEVAGRRPDAAEAFRQFLARAPGNRWAASARRHLAALTAAPASAAGVGWPREPRVVAFGTVLSTGGVAAPLLDAAWREQAAVLDDCLDTAAPPGPGEVVRLGIELEIDAHGSITGVSAKVPPAQGEPLARCLERAVKSRFRLRPPVPARATRARTELIIGFPSAERAGYR